jgi:hypothetical protein
MTTAHTPRVTPARPSSWPPACRFFLTQKDFEAESAIYGDDVLRELLPELVETHDNSAGGLVSPSGFAYPSFIVLGRGVTLRQWAKSARNFGEVLCPLYSAPEMHRLARSMHPSCPLP